MKLGELLTEDRIVIGAKGETVREAAQELAHAIIASGRATDPDRLDALLAESLPSEAVTLGQHAFLLHFRTDAVDDVTVALGIAPQPVHREHDPRKEGRIVLLILAPSRATPAYLRTVGTFARVLGREEIVAKLEKAETPEDVLALDVMQSVDVADQLLVRHVCAPTRVVAGPETTVGEAASLLAQHRLPALPVISEDDEVLGMVSYGELLRHLLPAHVKRATGELPGDDDAQEGDHDPMAVPVREMMDRSVLCLSEDQSLTDVARLMVDKKLERLPVVREGALVGMLTREGIVRRLFGP